MSIISFNIGYDLGGWTILSPFPIISVCQNIREFADIIRDDAKMLYTWSEVNFVPPETIVLYIAIKDGDYNRNLTIRAYGIREYRKLINSVKNEIIS